MNEEADVRFTQKQRERVRAIEVDGEKAVEVAEQAKVEAEAWGRAERRRIDDEMSSRILAASRGQTTAIADAKIHRAERLNQIEKEYRQALSAAESARVKSRNQAEAAHQATVDEAQVRFNAASAPVEQWYISEKARVVAETESKLNAATAALEAVVKPLVAEQAKIMEKAAARTAAEAQATARIAAEAQATATEAGVD